MRLALLTAGALLGFAANSLLTRAALGGGQLDAASFALIRVLSGALALVALSRFSSGGATNRSWKPALALTGYLAAFTLAYTRIGAAVGALLLFGSAQVTMIATGLARGERPSRVDWLGASLALMGLLTLAAPGITAPDSFGAALMILAGVCWGAYSLMGRGSAAPLADTSRNFVLSATVLTLPLGWLAWPFNGTASGVALATGSGTLASGLGYTLWYAALPSLTAWRAAILQFLVPIITAIGAAVWLHEPITLRLVLATVLVASGIWLTASPRWHRT